MTWLLVALGAAVGAPARYLIDARISRGRSAPFPLGTFTVNVIACALLGFVMGCTPSAIQHLLGTGLCGALSTYSTFSFETLRLAETGRARVAVSYVVGSILLGLLAAYAGLGVAQLFT